MSKFSIGTSPRFPAADIGALARSIARHVECNGDAVHAMCSLASAIAVCAKNAERPDGRTNPEECVSLLLTTFISACVEMDFPKDEVLAKVGAGIEQLLAQIAALEAGASGRVVRGGGVH